MNTTQRKELTPRQIANRQKKTLARIETEKNQKPVKEMLLTIEWVKSRTWGNNPRLEAGVSFKDGTFERSETFTCSGCGYDKESTVIAQAFNKYLKYKLWALTEEQIKGGNTIPSPEGKAPYGIANYSPEYRDYSGGIGTSCYYKIAEYIGGKFEHIASGKTFDVYKYTENP
jgi:hypothetical protein